MASFKDTKGRIWTIEVNVSAIRRVRSLIGIDLVKVVEADSEIINQLNRDVVFLCDVLFALIEPQAKAAGVTDEDFGAALSGDAVSDATTGLLEELVSFCPSPKMREALGAVIRADRQTKDRAAQMVATAVSSGALERIQEAELLKVKTSLQSLSGEPSTSMRALSESIPAHSPSLSSS